MLFAAVPGPGTPVISTVPASPGTSPFEAVVVTVTIPAASVSEAMVADVEDLVTSTPWRTPEPPGVTNAKWPWGAMATCGYWPVFRVTCAETQGGALAAPGYGRQEPLEPGFKLSR